MVATVRTAARAICQSWASPEAMRTGISTGASGGRTDRSTASGLSGLPTTQKTAKYVATTTMVMGVVTEATSSCRETSAPPAA
jgi:hypothetical protein